MKYVLTIAIFILAGAFVGCGVGALAGNPSAGTGYGCAVGLLAGAAYCYATRNANG